MPYWVEVHCDTTLAERDAIPADKTGQCQCETSKAEAPGFLARNVSDAATYARAEAKALGWKRVGNRGLMCPACQKYIFGRNDK